MAPSYRQQNTKVVHDGVTLFQRDDEFSIKAENYELMNSRVHGSEDALGKLACSRE